MRDTEGLGVWEGDCDWDRDTQAEALPVFVTPTVTTVTEALGEVDMVRETECVREALRVHTVAVAHFVIPPLLTVRVRVTLTVVERVLEVLTVRVTLTVGERVLVASPLLTVRVRVTLTVGERVLVAPTLTTLRVTESVLERLPVGEDEELACACAPPRNSSE